MTLETVIFSPARGLARRALPGAAGRDPAGALAALALLTVAAVCLARGMPWANVDDLAFVGAGMDLAETGELTNRFMRGWLAGFGTDRFYIQLPVYSYSLAGWIKGFGAGAASFAAFQWVWYAVGIAGLLRLLGRFGVGRAAGCSLALIYLTQVVKQGFRPEAEAFGLVFAGLSVLETTAAFWRQFVALLLMGFGVLVYPLALGVALPFGAAVLAQGQRSEGGGLTQFWSTTWRCSGPGGRRARSPSRRSA